MSTDKLWRTPSSHIVDAKSNVKKLAGRTPKDPQVGLADEVAHPELREATATPPTSQLTLLPADSLASLLVSPGSDEARKMTAGSGLKCLESLRRSDRNGLLRRTLLGSSTWGSTIVYLTWRISATVSNRILFQLVPRVPRTDGIESSLWATITVGDVWNSVNSVDQGVEKHHLNAEVKMWPTPKQEPSGPDYARAERPESGGDDLATAVAKTMWPTPRNRMTGAATPKRTEDKNLNLETAVARTMWPTPRGSDGAKGGPNQRDGSGSLHLPAAVMYQTPMPSDVDGGRTTKGKGRPNETGIRVQVGGQLNPDWVETVMGFEVGHTDIGTETGKLESPESPPESPIE